MSRTRPATPVLLDARDEELLELAAIQVPWYMVCGEFHTRYGSPGALARRLIELRRHGLVEVRGDGAGLPADAAALEADAIENDCYRNVEDTRDPRWTVVTSDAGAALIAHRLERE